MDYQIGSMWSVCGLVDTAAGRSSKITTLRNLLTGQAYHTLEKRRKGEVVCAVRSPVGRGRASGLTANGASNPRKRMAEREGFEPSVPRKQYTGLAVQHLKPLSHLSALKSREEDS